jgi:hypothetical protein
MPFEFKKVFEHGTTNPIVARLSLQILEILKQCNASKDIQDKIGDLYLNSLQKKLLRCWEIEERFKKKFAAAVGKYKPPNAANAPVEVPQIARLEEECHNFLYEAKNYIRDLLQVLNHLYGTTFVDASEFSRAKKGSQSLVEFAEKTFGADDGKTKFLKEAVPSVEELIAVRNAVEHPEGLSGKLFIANFTLGADRKLDRPTWHREKDGKLVTEPSSIRADMEASINNLLTLGEDVFVSWASDHLQVPAMMRVAFIPEDRRNPLCPIKWTVTASQHLEDLLAKAEHRVIHGPGWHLNPIIGPEGKIQLYDIYIENQWIGSRSTESKCLQAIRNAGGQVPPEQPFETRN